MMNVADIKNLIDALETDQDVTLKLNLSLEEYKEIVERAQYTDYSP